MFIYVITNSVNGKVYVGKTEHRPQRRWAAHLRDNVRRPHVAPLLYRAMHKYGANAFIFEVVCQANSIEQLNHLEQLWIWALRAAEGMHGYNLTLGGTGGVPNEATLEKLRHPKSLEMRAKLSAAAKLRPRNTEHMNTEAARAKKSIKLKGRIFSEETKLKMSLAARARALSNPEHLVKARASRAELNRDEATGRYVAS